MTVRVGRASLINTIELGRGVSVTPQGLDPLIVSQLFPLKITQQTLA